MRYAILILILFAVVAIPASADNVTANETINQTPMDPLIFNFAGGHMFGENPVLFIDQSNGNTTIANTSSKAITLPPDRDYYVRVEPAGISDAMNAPDAGVVGLMKWAEKNPLGTFFGSLILALFLMKAKRGL
jgi:hypothetical protein